MRREFDWTVGSVVEIPIAFFPEEFDERVYALFKQLIPTDRDDVRAAIGFHPEPEPHPRMNIEMFFLYEKPTHQAIPSDHAESEHPFLQSSQYPIDFVTLQ